MLLFDAYVRPSWRKWKPNGASTSRIWPRDTREIPSPVNWLQWWCWGCHLHQKVMFPASVILLWRSPLWHRQRSLLYFPLFPSQATYADMSNVQHFFPKKIPFECLWLWLCTGQENGTSNTFSCWNLLEAGRDAKSQILCCTETFCTVRTMGPEWDASSHHAIHSIVGKSLAPVASAAGGRQNTEDRRWQE